MPKAKDELILILHNLRSAYNVGAIFRIAACLPTPLDRRSAVSKIYLTGHTPAPRDRFGRSNRALVKVALGAENIVPWQHSLQLNPILYNLTTNHYHLISLEQSPLSVNYKKIKLKSRTAIIAGNEVRGVPPAILKKCDQVAEIPMGKGKESLNVAVALGVFLFHLKG